MNLGHLVERKLPKTNSNVPKEHKSQCEEGLSWTNEGTI